MSEEGQKKTPESKSKRAVSKAPRPIEGVRTGSHVWQPPEPAPKQEPVQIPDCTPFVSPKLAARTAVIVAEAARKYPMQAQMPELCKHVIAELTPHFRDTVVTRTVREDVALSQMGGLLHELLGRNSDNTNRWMLGGPGATAASFEYPLEKTLRQSDEWLAFLRAIGDAAGQTERKEQPPVVASSEPTLKWQDIEVVFLSEHSVQVFVGGKPSPSCKYSELGFEDRKSGKPMLAWETLCEMARTGGTIPRPLPGSDKTKVQKRIEEIRKKLKAYFKIESDPIPFSGHTYQTTFKIRLGTSFDS